MCMILNVYAVKMGNSKCIVLLQWCHVVLNVLKCRLHIYWNVKWKVLALFAYYDWYFSNRMLNCFSVLFFLFFWHVVRFVDILILFFRWMEGNDYDWKCKYVCVFFFYLFHCIVVLTLNVELIMVSRSMAGVWLVLVKVLHYSLLLYRDVKSFDAVQHGLDVALDIVLLAQEALPIVPNNKRIHQ